MTSRAADDVSLLTRRTLLTAFAASALVAKAKGTARGAEPRTRGGAPLAFGDARPFSWDGLVARARAAVASPYVPRPDPAPDVLKAIGYEQHNAIRQPAQAGLFAGEARDGAVTGFHLGELFRRPVTIHAVDGGMARELLYREDYFSYPADSAAARMPPGAGFAGFRVHEPTRLQDEQPGDWLAFLGASYFRSSGDARQYGISARGLALETGALDGRDEEFPDFTDFWIEEMQGGILRIFALLQGPSVTGAYRFDVAHFPNVTMDVACRLFLRRDVVRLGVAPLTSMYWYSQETRWAQGDWRPEVHDSDGLLIHDAQGGAIFRPLTNPPTIAFSSFLTKRPRGFGMIQRDRDYRNYQDAAAFERRPNLWVEPFEGFDDGSVQLIEFPTQVEYGDNIVAFYTPARPAKAGDTLDFRYRLHWSVEEPAMDQARMTTLRLGRPLHNRPPAGENRPARFERKIVLDYAGAVLGSFDPNQAKAEIAMSHGRPVGARLQRSVDVADGWRLVFDAFCEKTDMCEVIVDILAEGRRRAEQVVFRFQPDEGLAA